MSLQIEDIFDVVSIVYPNCDFLVLMDQSSGHGKKMHNGLNATPMSAKYGGAQPKMRNTVINEVGPYQPHLNVGDTQQMVFSESDEGPYYLQPSGRDIYKVDFFTGEIKILTKNKKMILDELKSKGF